MRPALTRAGPLLIGLALLLPTLADARLGGGENFGGGGGGGGGGGFHGGGGFTGGGGGGGDGGDALFLLIRLILIWPEVGIPVAILLFLVVLAKGASRGPGVVATRHVAPAAAPVGPRRRNATEGLAALQAADPGFSRPALIGQLALVHRRALEAVATGVTDPLLPYVNAATLGTLKGHLAGATLERVVVGRTSLDEVRRAGDQFQLHATFVTSLLMDGRPWIVETTWRFVRAAGAVSAEPDAVSRLGCPACGAASDVDPLGACRSCHQAVTKGQQAWLATGITSWDRRVAPGADLRAHHGGVEAGYHAPTSRDPDLAVQLRRLAGRHGGFDRAAFEGRTRDLFMALQTAWSEGRMQDVRAWVTDDLWQSFRFYADPYERDGLRNALGEIQLERQEITAASADAWYESVTVRLWARCIDTVVDRQGKVVAGDARTPRAFSEYWTLLRTPGAKGGGDLHHCPSCAAPLDKVNAAGVCGYCDTRVSTGRFDWVLARIDQAGA